MLNTLPWKAKKTLWWRVCMTGMNKGNDDYSTMIENIIAIDRSFNILLNSLEPLGALALVRIQLDNLKHLYAEKKYPGRVLHRIFENGWELNQVKVNGQAIKSGELLNELEEKYGRINQIWKHYCDYVHPSKSQVNLQIKTHFNYLRFKKVPNKKDIKYFSWDMVYVNMIITNVLLSRLKELLAIAKAKGKYGDYLKAIRLAT